MVEGISIDGSWSKHVHTFPNLFTFLSLVTWRVEDSYSLDRCPDAGERTD